MIRKTLTILSLIGLLLSVGLWGVSYWRIGYFLENRHQRFLYLAGGAFHCGFFKYPLERVDLVRMGTNPTLSFVYLDRSKKRTSWWFEGLDNRQKDFVLKNVEDGFSIGSPANQRVNPFTTLWWPLHNSRPWMWWFLSVPFWIPTILFAFLSSFPLRTFYRRRKRKKLGLCLKCGYDLRASKDRCPECGKEFGSTGVEG